MPIIWGAWNSQIIETGSRTVVVRDRGEEGMGNYCLMGTEFQIYKTKRVRWWIAGTVALQHELYASEWLRWYILCYVCFTTINRKNVKRSPLHLHGRLYFPKMVTDQLLPHMLFQKKWSQFPHPMETGWELGNAWMDRRQHEYPVWLPRLGRTGQRSIYLPSGLTLAQQPVCHEQA